MNRLLLASLLIVPAFLPSSLQAQFNIGTAAGGGPDNVLGVMAPISTPSGIAVDSSGNVYFSSRDQHRVFRLATDGKIHVVAGYGRPDYGGDGGLAVNAGLRWPRGVALNAAQTHLYIADTENYIVRRVDLATGIITTVAGSPGVSGATGDGGLAINARLSALEDVGLDAAGNLYIADTFNHKVRRVNASNQIITTFAGTGVAGSTGDGGTPTAAQLRNPSSVAVSSAGVVYISETQGHRVRRVANNVISTFAGNGVAGFDGDGGPATVASLSQPRGVRLDTDGNLLIADHFNSRIRKVNTSTGIITTVAGSDTFGFSGDGGLATSAQLNGPMAVGSDANYIYIADSFNARVRRVTKSSGIIETVAGNGSFAADYGGDGALAPDAMLLMPGGVTTDSAGNLFIADTNNHRIRRVDAETGVITTFAGSGVAGFSGDGGAAISASFNAPTGLVMDAAGNLYVADSENDRIRKITPAGTITTYAGTGVAGFAGDNGAATSARLNDPVSLAIDGAGNLLIVDRLNHRVRSVNQAGIITTIAGTGVAGFLGDGAAATSARLNTPNGIAVDTAGNIYIADRNNHRIRRISGGTITTVAGSGTAGSTGDGGSATAARLNFPRGVALDAAGNIYIADSSNNRIRRVVGGIISTIAGTGTQGFGGDGGAGTSATLYSPTDIEVGPNGIVFIAEPQNNRVRALASSCAFQLTATSANLSPAAQGPYTIGVDTTTGCTWTATSDSPSWLQVTSGVNGSGPADVSFTVAANTGAARTGHLTIAGITYTVTQNAAPVCTYTLGANAASLSSAAQGPYSIEVITQSGCAWTAVSNAPSWLTVTSNASGSSGGFTFFSVAENTGTERVGTLTIAGRTYTVTQAAPVPVTPVGPQVTVFRSGAWFVDRNVSFGWNAGDSFHYFGASTDKPITGDWTNSGVLRMGVFRDGVWYLDINNNGQWDGTPTDAIAFFGTAGDTPVVGDWTGTGRMRIGVFRQGIWFLDLNEDRFWNGTPTDTFIYFGTTGDVPVVGDWTNTGQQRIGIFRDGLWYVDLNGNNNWDGPGTDTSFYFGTAGDKPVIVDWSGSGHRRIGIYRNGYWVVDLNGNNGYDGGDSTFWFGGLSEDQPLAL